MAPEREDIPAVLGVPDLDRLILAARGDPRAIGAERDTVDETRVSTQGSQDPTGGRILDLHDRLAGHGGRDPPAVGAGHRAITHLPTGAEVPLEVGGGRVCFAGGRVPDLDGLAAGPESDFP